MGEEMRDRIVAIVAEIAGVEEDEITLESTFDEDLEIDSVRAIEVVVALEKAFRVNIRDEEIPQIRTVGDAIAMVVDLVAAKGS